MLSSSPCREDFSILFPCPFLPASCHHLIVNCLLLPAFIAATAARRSSFVTPPVVVATTRLPTHHRCPTPILCHSPTPMHLGKQSQYTISVPRMFS